MRRVLSFLCMAACLFLAGPLVTHAGEYQSAPYKGSPEFERVKQLVGAWEGTSGMGKAGEKTRVEYRLTAGGSALVESLLPGNEGEMVSVYHDQNGKLAMTHYCMLRNQPHMVLAKSDAQSLELVFALQGNVIDPAKEKHRHAVSFTFTDNDHFVQKWTMFDKGKNAGEVAFTLTRVR